MEVLDDEQLKLAETLLCQSFPQSLQVYGYIYQLNRVKADRMDVLVDRWPDFNIVLVRPVRQEEADFFKDLCIYCKDRDTLKKILLETETVNWQNYLCLGVDLCYQDVISSVAASRGVTGDKVSVCHVLKLEDPSNLPQIDSASVTLSSLNESHIPLVNKTWKFGDGKYSTKFIKNMICHFPSCCILGNDGQPVAWVLSYAHCAMGMLYTLPEHRQQGYAKIVISAMSQKLHRQGCPVFCFIEEENKVSFKLFTSLGFKEEPSFRATWFRFNQFH